MSNRLCTICGKPIALVPSAQERAKKTGESPAYFTALFQQHGECVVKKREEETLKLMRRMSQ